MWLLFLFIFVEQNFKNLMFPLNTYLFLYYKSFKSEAKLTIHVAIHLEGREKPLKEGQ